MSTLHIEKKFLNHDGVLQIPSELQTSLYQAKDSLELVIHSILDVEGDIAKDSSKHIADKIIGTRSVLELIAKDINRYLNMI
jgi:hypothetical protein